MNISALPQPHRGFLERALPALEGDPRLAGVGVQGSAVTGGFDEFSDLDLVVAVTAEAYDEVMADRRRIAAGLGNLLGAFTGEHVAEPRLLICLYGPTPLHVDLKFVRVDETAERTEDPAVLSDTEGQFTTALDEGTAAFPEPELQWIEDRFWIWIHYGVCKVGRGELFEAHDFLAFLRMQVLGPLALKTSGARPSGVRRIETEAPDWVEPLCRTLAGYDRDACLDALQAAAEIYIDLRDGLADDGLIRGRSAEIAALETLAAIRAT